MASQMHSARHVSAQATILIWLSAIVLIAGAGMVVIYHSLRDHSIRGDGLAAHVTALVRKASPRHPAPARVAMPSATMKSINETARAHAMAVAAARKPRDPGDD